MAKYCITCPNCGLVLGDTDHSLDCNINCRGCKQTQHIVMKVQDICDFYQLKKKEKDNDKSE